MAAKELCMADIRFGEDYRLKRFWWYVASLWPLKCLRGEKLVLHKAEKRIKGPAIVVDRKSVV